MDIRKCSVCKSSRWNINMNGTTYCNECFKKKMKENNGVIENGDCSITFEGNIEIDQKEKE